VLFLLPLALGVAGLVALTFLANRVMREVAPTMTAVDRFGREHRVALNVARDRLRAETTETRRRISGD
jgi:hypothetical protein